MRQDKRIVPQVLVAVFMSVPLTAHAQDANTDEVARTAEAVDTVEEKSLQPKKERLWFPIELGVRLDSSFSRFGTIPGVEQDYQIFPSGSLVIRFQFAKGNGIQTGLSYIRKGSKIPGFMQDLTGDYLTLPVLFRTYPESWSITPRAQLYAIFGGYASLLVGGTILDNDVSRFDAGATIGLGVSVHATPSWIVDIGLQASQGITNLDAGERTNLTFLAGLTIMWDRGSDSDGDRLLNRHESTACFGSAEDWDGFEDEDGCADPDNDQDGYPDVIDQCPDEREDPDGFEDWDGCSDPDNDDDGVADNDDQCPEPFWGPLERPDDRFIYVPTDGSKSYAHASSKLERLGCFPEYAELYVTSSRLRLKAGYRIDGFQARQGPQLTRMHKDSLDEVVAFLQRYPFRQVDDQRSHE